MAVIEQGSTILVTGANGFIASHIVEQLVQAGYKARGTVRTEAKGRWLQEYINEKYGKDKLELAIVSDMSAKGAFNDAVKGTSGVVHVASNLSFDKDPNAVIPSTIAGIENTLDAAETEPLVKRFVFTSSSTAATNPKPDTKFDIDENTWNDECVKAAWAPPPYEPQRAWDVYGASKTQAEQALWKYAKERKPHFEVNAVLPNANFGTIIRPEAQAASTAGWITTLYKDGLTDLANIPPQWFVNVQDTARLHVAALIDPSIVNERIFAFSEPYTWNSILAMLRKIRPDHKFPENIDNESKDLSNVLPRSRAVEILQKHFGQSDFIGLEESLKQNIAHLE